MSFYGGSLTFELGASKVYVKGLELNDNITLAASAAYQQTFEIPAEDLETDVFVGFSYKIHPDSDPTLLTDPMSDINVSFQAGTNNTVYVNVYSYSGTPSVPFIHLSVWGVWATVL